jgi:hypothetical protein
MIVQREETFVGGLSNCAYVLNMFFIVNDLLHIYSTVKHTHISDDVVF